MHIITGGAGFIGSNLVAGLEKAGHGPLVVCDWLNDARKKPNIAKRRLEAVITPEELPDFLKKHGAKVEAIFHMGAISSTTETDLSKLRRYNFDYSKNLYEWCAENGKRLIYASSAATYGDGTQGFEDKEDVGSLEKLQPLNPYGRSKNDFDIFVAQSKAAGGKQPAQCVGLKFFNVYGPNEYHKDGQRSVAQQVYEYAARDEAFPLFKSHNPAYPDGGQKRDFVWVGDCVAIMLWFLQNPRANGLFNVASGTARPFADLAAAVYKALGKEPKITYVDMPENIRRHYQYFTEGPMDKLLKAGYDKPLTALEEGVNRYVREYLATHDPYC